jgi:hypothetical protein
MLLAAGIVEWLCVGQVGNSIGDCNTITSISNSHKLLLIGLDLGCIGVYYSCVGNDSATE